MRCEITLWTTVWQQYDQRFCDALEIIDLQHAHIIWSRAAEDFLRQLLSDGIGNVKQGNYKRGHATKLEESTLTAKMIPEVFTAKTYMNKALLNLHMSCQHAVPKLKQW